MNIVITLLRFIGFIIWSVVIILVTTAGQYLKIFIKTWCILFLVVSHSLKFADFWQYCYIFY